MCQHPSQEVLVHRINTCFGVSTPLFGLQKWMTGSIQCTFNILRRKFLHSHQIPAKGGSFRRSNLFRSFFCFGPQRGKILSTPEVFQHRANTVPTLCQHLFGPGVGMCQHLFGARCWHTLRAKSVPTLDLNPCMHVTTFQ